MKYTSTSIQFEINSPHLLLVCVIITRYYYTSLTIYSISMSEEEADDQLKREEIREETHELQDSEAEEESDDFVDEET